MLTETNTQLNLPPGYTARPATLEDVPAITRLLNRTSQVMISVEDYNETELRKELQAPGLDLAADSLAIFAPGGELAAYQDMFALVKPQVYPMVFGRVDPDHMNRGLGGALLAWADGRAAQHLAAAPEHLRFAIRAFAYGGWQPAADLLAGHGFTLFRHAFKMRRDFDGEVDAPEWPQGIRIETYNHPGEAEAVYRAIVDAFQDHYGYIHEPFESGFPRFQHFALGDEAFDPALWFLARDGDQIAGMSLCRKWDDEDRTAGYVATLGVRRPWRKRGLGRALLLHSFRAFDARGLKAATLHVDAGSLTGAVRLYEKAGMHVHRRIDRYEKVLRAGEEISTTALE
ncbi:MAG: GNAT family N-acetyltransferase [Chloroflexi bacterium]|nr:GNAT family N-acetyltransferase [Chloroflexota bacterium]